MKEERRQQGPGREGVKEEKQLSVTCCESSTFHVAVKHQKHCELSVCSHFTAGKTKTQRS